MPTIKKKEPPGFGQTAIYFINCSYFAKRCDLKSKTESSDLLPIIEFKVRTKSNTKLSKWWSYECIKKILRYLGHHNNKVKKK